MITTTDSKQKLATAIRGWIHMDNLTESLTHQATNARKLRAKHEEEAIQIMKQLGLHNSTIQVSGASLQLTTRKSTSGLTWGFLETEIAGWATKQGLTASHAQSLMKWLHDHRETNMVEYLKKTESKQSVT